jgi:hypothetical protein
VLGAAKSDTVSYESTGAVSVRNPKFKKHTRNFPAKFVQSPEVRMREVFSLDKRLLMGASSSRLSGTPRNDWFIFRLISIRGIKPLLPAVDISERLIVRLALVYSLQLPAPLSTVNCLLKAVLPL